MSETERDIRFLLEEGYTREEVRRRIDEGGVLGYIGADVRPGLWGAEAVREYRRADRELSHLAAYFVHKGDVVTWRFLEDAAERAGELALRAERGLEAS